MVKVLNAPLTWGTQYAVITEALWALSEFDGKTDGCKLWSELAWSSRSSQKMLRHDHAIPRVILVNKLKSLRLNAEEVSVRDILNLAIGVVITKAEDVTLTKLGLRSALPPGDSDPMSRYRAAKIKVIRPYDSAVPV